MSDIYSVAREYGRALFMLTEELGRTEAVRDEALALGALLRDMPEYTQLLDTPALSIEERVALIDEAFGGLDEYLVNLVKLLAERRLAYLIARTLTAFEEEYMESRGIARAEAITAVALTEDEARLLKEKLEAITGKQIIIENKIDPSILGGIKLRYMGIQRDGTVKTRLDTFRRLLGDAVV